MQQIIIMANAGELADALEDWMIDNKTPVNTQEEWNKFFEHLLKIGLAKPLGVVDNEEVPMLKEELKKLGAKDFKDIKEEQ